MASAIEVRAIPNQPVHDRYDLRQAELLVSFTARAAVTSALSDYNVFVEEPDSGTCARGHAGVGTGENLARDIKAGERAQVVLSSGYGNASSLFPGCPGIAHGTVSYEIPSVELSSAGSYVPFLEGRARRVMVGQFTYHNP